MTYREAYQRLAASRAWNAAELADALGCSVRTLYRCLGKNRPPGGVGARRALRELLQEEGVAEAPSSEDREAYRIEWSPLPRRPWRIVDAEGRTFSPFLRGEHPPRFDSVEEALAYGQRLGLRMVMPAEEGGAT